MDEDYYDVPADPDEWDPTGWNETVKEKNTQAPGGDWEDY